jgi:hypothetical protein
MCYFITIGIHESKGGYLEEQARPEMSAWRCENSQIMAHLHEGFQGYVLTTGMCSCDLYRSPAGDETSEDTTQRLHNRYKKKGWTEAKIQRAIADATAAGNLQVRGLRTDARELIARVADASNRVYVFVHMYSGNQMTEEVKVKHGPTVRSSEFRSDGYILETDTLVTVNGQNRR